MCSLKTKVTLCLFRVSLGKLNNVFKAIICVVEDVIVSSGCPLIILIFSFIFVPSLCHMIDINRLKLLT